MNAQDKKDMELIKFIKEELYENDIRTWDALTKATHEISFTRYLGYYISHLNKNDSHEFISNSDTLDELAIAVADTLKTDKGAVAFLEAFRLISEKEFINSNDMDKISSLVCKMAHDYYLNSKADTLDGPRHIFEFHIKCCEDGVYNDEDIEDDSDIESELSDADYENHYLDKMEANGINDERIGWYE